MIVFLRRVGPNLTFNGRFDGGLGGCRPGGGIPASVPEGSRAVVLNMHRLISMDTSGLDALAQFHAAMERRGITLLLASVNEQPLGLMRRAGFEARLGPEQIINSVQDWPATLEGSRH